MTEGWGVPKFPNVLSQLEFFSKFKIMGYMFQIFSNFYAKKSSCFKSTSRREYGISNRNKKLRLFQKPSVSWVQQMCRFTENS